MELDSALTLSYYRQIGVINEEHHIYLVQHVETHRIYVKKELDVFSRDVYVSLKNHPISYIPRVYEVAEDEGKLVVIEEYVFGETLDSMLNRHYRLEEREVRAIAVQMCEILIALHGQQPPIIHRDIKPSNVILTPSGSLFLLDLNAAKYESSGKEEDTMLLGTKGYAAPEQYGFGTSNARTDIYALGMLMNTLMLGTFSQVPYEGTNISKVIRKCIELNPKDRYKNVQDLKTALGAPATPSAVSTAPVDDFHQYLPPGFRSGNVINMIVATLGYFTIFGMGLTMTFSGSTVKSVPFERFTVIVLLLSMVFLSCDYLGVQHLFPPCRTSNKLLKILSVIVLDVIVFLILAVILLSIESIL